jgi:hypothetical protein
MRSADHRWNLTEPERLELLKRFPAACPEIHADHVTAGRMGQDIRLEEETGWIVGIANEDGLQALVVEIGGTVYRPDGSIYHVTWSLDRAQGRRPVDSNALLQKFAWERISPPIAIKLLPVHEGSRPSR